MDWGSIASQIGGLFGGGEKEISPTEYDKLNRLGKLKPGRTYPLRPLQKEPSPPPQSLLEVRKKQGPGGWMGEIGE